MYTKDGSVDNICTRGVWGYAFYRKQIQTTDSMAFSLAPRKLNIEKRGECSGLLEVARCIERKTQKITAMKKAVVEKATKWPRITTSCEKNTIMAWKKNARGREKAREIGWNLNFEDDIDRRKFWALAAVASARCSCLWLRNVAVRILRLASVADKYARVGETGRTKQKMWNLPQNH